MSLKKIISVFGPKEDIGKTIFSINLATQYAISTKRKVVILDADIRFRNDVSYYLNSSIFETISNLWNSIEKVKLEGLDTSLFKGRINFNEQGVGIVSIAKSFKNFQLLKPAYLVKFLAIFGELYDFFIDIENIPEDFILPLYDISDKVFGIMDPKPINLKNTVEYFLNLSSKNFNMNKFNIILNRIGLPETLLVKQINSKLLNFGKSIIFEIPEEKNVYQAVSIRQIIVEERPYTIFAKKIGELVDWCLKVIK